jgi:hypothetical protein
MFADIGLSKDLNIKFKDLSSDKSLLFLLFVCFCGWVFGWFFFSCFFFSKLVDWFVFASGHDLFGAEQRYLAVPAADATHASGATLQQPRALHRFLSCWVMGFLLGVWVFGVFCFVCSKKSHV